VYQRTSVRSARGHSRPSLSLDVDSHVMPADEIPAGSFIGPISASG
jgi:hypothetical protein